MTESPRRPLMNEWSKTGYRSYTSPSDRLSKRLGASLPNLEQPANDAITAVISHRTASLRKMSPDVGQCWGSHLEMISRSFFFLNLIYFFPGLKFPQKPIKVFRLPEFPPPLAYHYVQNYYSDMVALLGKAINATPPEESALLARYYSDENQEANGLQNILMITPCNCLCVRYHYLRGLVNTVSNRRVDALEDFQSLYKTDSDIFPLQMVKSLVDSLTEAERLQVS